MKPDADYSPEDLREIITNLQQLLDATQMIMMITYGSVSGC